MEETINAMENGINRVYWDYSGWWILAIKELLLIMAA